MRRAVLALLPAVLVAQAPKRVPKQDPWQAFLQELKRHQPATLVVLETGATPWEGALQPLLHQEPLVALGLPLRALRPDDPGGRAILERLGWSMSAPRWALVDARGRSLAEGATLPTSEVLARAYREAGLKTRAEQLQEFLAKHPAHDEARILLIQELRRLAERRTCLRLGLAAPVPAKGGGQVAIQGMVVGEAPPPPPSLPEKDLDADQDEALWGAYGKELRVLFEGGTWMNRMLPEMPAFVRSMGMQIGGQELFSDYARVSPTVRELCARVLPQLERLLEHRPSHTYAWSLWLAASRLAGQGDMKALMNRLAPLPGSGPKDWPPLLIRTAYYQDCRRREDWRAMQEMAEAQLETLRTLGQAMGDLGEQTLSKQAKEAARRLFYDEGAWTSAGEPLLEAYLRQQKGADADRLVREWAAGSGGSMVVKARALARACGQKDLDERWKELEKPS